MAEFRRKPLGLLDRIYRFVGGLRGVSEMSLETPIQLVHDVSRQSEFGENITGPGQGYFVNSTDYTPGAGTTYNSFDPQTLIATLGGSDMVPWLIDCWATQSAAGVVSVAVVGQTWGTHPNVFDNESRMLAYWSTGGVEVQLTAAGPVTIAGILTSEKASEFPIPFLDNSFLLERATGLGAGTITIGSLWWVGPTGTTPPGMP